MGEGVLEDERAFAQLCDALRTWALWIADQLNAGAGDPAFRRRACIEARLMVQALSILERRVEATPLDRALDPQGVWKQVLWGLEGRLIADQQQAGGQCCGARASVGDRDERIEAREQLMRALERLRLVLFERELDVRMREQPLSLEPARAVLTRLGLMR
ncbi:hypothetical protein [Halorhodospira halophila]|uniref:hypothetical protein n=1 Tax=Halorhodospira halophila TaxID=1053 RepID=UPI0019114A54|nr:hypothetical protein [Halorhodospira halophila]MBK5935783.1 hypothetical protein [Halorhodospira halophila]